MEETAIALEESPCGAAVTKNVAKAVERASSCPSCRRRAHQQMVHFTEAFALELDKSIAKVSKAINGVIAIWI
jgi:AICAR transformylase/IMP cyclohydrolase PurH